MKTQSRSNFTKGCMMLILSAFCFACMNICVRFAGDLPSIQKSFFRNFISAIFATVIVLQKHTSLKVAPENRLPLFLRCLAGSIGILCNFYAVDHLVVADASILNKLSPFFAILFSFLILKEKIQPFQIFCIVLSFIGCLFVVKPGFSNISMRPFLIGILGGISAGLAYTMVRRLGTHGAKGPVIVFYFSYFSCLMVAPMMLLDFHPMSIMQLLALLLAGLLAAGGQFSITAAYTYASAGKISIFDYSQIIFATLLGFFFFGELPDMYSFFGYILIISASLIMFLYNMNQNN